MHYIQYRLAKRNGEIVMQKRNVTTTTKNLFKWYQFWKWGLFEIEREYTEWVDEPFIEVV